MRLFKGNSVIACSFVLFSFASLRANPNPPTAYMLLSEVQVTDQAHWAIEVLYKNPFQRMPLTADSLTNLFSLVYKNVPPTLRPKIKVSSNGYAVIRSQDYDSLLLKAHLSGFHLYFYPGDTVKLHYDYQRAMNPNDTVHPGDTAGVIWECIINKNIKPTQSMVCFQKQGFSPYLVWCKSDSPTIGFSNNEVGIYGAIKGFVCNKDSQALANVSVRYNCYVPGMVIICTAKTDSSGCFVAPNLVSSDLKTFSFPGLSSDSFGPFSVEPECTLTVVCKLNDVSTAIHNSVFRSPTSSVKIVGITKSKSDILIVFNGSNNVADYNVEVFSLAGKKMYSAIVSNNGSGTYSVTCSGVNGKGMSPGSYIARIITPSASVEKRFTVQ
jgi:hypothetical protein